MTTIDPGTVFAAGVAVVALVVWLVRLEGRINLADERMVDLKADITEIKDDVKKLLVKV